MLLLLTIRLPGMDEGYERLFERAMGVNDVDDESYFPCPEDGCAYWYGTSSELNEHIARDHCGQVDEE